ncbi:uncharacterized protein VTP21DRAFT_7028 [Calcarisporiella thermophila]|uniref:uncharacterized protein n=1 Tax=Calcarisporiella thermophila TaxID=911321 RepID=UPI0037446634
MASVLQNTTSAIMTTTAEPSSTSSAPKFEKSGLAPLPTIDQTPTRFLAACSNLELEPNPFEQSFSGLATGDEKNNGNLGGISVNANGTVAPPTKIELPSPIADLANQTNASPRPILPPVASIASPSAPLSTGSFSNWDSLRTGPLSPSMLQGPQNPGDFTLGRLSGTPTGGSFPFQPSALATFLGNPNSPGGGVALLNNVAAFNGRYTGTFLNAPPGAAHSMPAAVRPSAPIALPVAQSTSSSQPPASIPHSSVVVQQNLPAGGTHSYHPATSKAASGPRLKTSAADKDTRARSDSLSSSVYSNLGSPTMSQIGLTISEWDRGKAAGEDGMLAGLPSSSLSTDDKDNHRKRRKTSKDSSAGDDGSNDRQDGIKGEKPRRKGKIRSSKDIEDEDKRKDFLERNRQAALKCRQRKKQWLANLQSNLEMLTEQNNQLQKQTAVLQEELSKLRNILMVHKDCPLGVAASAIHGASGSTTIGTLLMNGGRGFSAGVGIAAGANGISTGEGASQGLNGR